MHDDGNSADSSVRGNAERLALGRLVDDARVDADPRSHVATAVAGGRLYVIGGLTGRALTGSRSVERYDPRADRWEKTAELEVAVDHAMAVGVGDDVFLFGGGLAVPTELAVGGVEFGGTEQLGVVEAIVGR